MLIQHYEDYNIEDYSCSSSESGTDLDDNGGNFIYNEQGAAIMEEIRKADVEFEKFLKTYENEGDKPC